MISLEILSASYLNNLERIESGAFSSLPNLTTLILNDNPNNSFFHPGSILQNFFLPNIINLDIDVGVKLEVGCRMIFLTK